jgi:hypothetical protein
VKAAPWIALACLLAACASCGQPPRSVCADYVKAVCDFCGAESETCSGMKERYSTCGGKKTCVKEICEGSLKTMRENTKEENELILCPGR